MKLRSGIYLHNQLQEGYDAISINSGTVCHTEQAAETVNFQGLSFQPQYEDMAYVVKRDWRRLTPQEKGCLRANGQGNHHNTVYVGDIPEALKECFQQSDVAGAKSQEEVLTRFRGDEKSTKELSAALSAFLTPLAANRPFHFRVIATNFPNTEMLGCNLSKLPAGYRPDAMR